MDIAVSNLDEYIVDVRLVGRLDSPGVDRIELRFTASLVPHGKHGIVDLSAVSLVTSMGLRMLITVAKALGAKHKRLAVYAPQEPVRTALESAMLGQIVPICTDRDAAAAAVRA